ncbi:MAG: hypothetical protein NTV94_08370 [Planctomycetota bacterium]|nr:hypothetical protein [Planctomycetota bacterium]
MSEPPVAAARKSSFSGGLSLLILVALALQLPTLHVAFEGSASGRDWSPWRLVSQPVVIREQRAAHRQREIPAAARLAGVTRGASVSAAHIRLQQRAMCPALLAVHLLDLPPPAGLA